MKIDWEGARRRIGHSREAMDWALEPGPEKIASVFRARAARLARPATGGAPRDESAVLVFTVGGDRYGIELDRVSEVVAGVSCSPVPGAPAELAGVVQVRGEIRPVWDVSRLLGHNGDAAPDASRVLLIDRGKREYGLRVHGVEGVRRFGKEDRRDARDRPAYVRYLTPDLVAVMDPDALLKRESS
jgi:purine-binding chemotaxis protein CheW